MRVAFLCRLGLLEQGGGDKVQIENTAKELRKLGVDVDILADLTVDISKYDIVHIFQLDWQFEPYFYAKKAYMANKPIVLSPIHHIYSEVKRYDDEYVFGYRRIAKYLFKNQYSRDTLKIIYKSIQDIRKPKFALITALKGLKRMHFETLKLANTILVQTDMEAHDLIHLFNINFKWVKIPNGVGEQFIQQQETYKNKLDFTNYIISVGRLEPRKNHLTLIKAIEEIRIEKSLDLKLVLIGISDYNTHLEYTLRLNNIMRNKNWIIHLEKIQYSDIPSYYKFAKVGVSLSWFESTGLTSLETLFCGTNVVYASRPTKEYIDAYGYYCDPGNIKSIKEAIYKAYFAPRPVLDINIQAMQKDYSWYNIALRTLQIYKELLIE